MAIVKEVRGFITSDHPFSVGYAVDLIIHDIPRRSDGTEGMLATDEARKADTMHISVQPSGTVARVVELVVHEANHLVDLWIKRCALVPCTETRSYVLDWVVGKALHNIVGNLNWSDLPIPPKG